MLGGGVPWLSMMVTCSGELLGAVPQLPVGPHSPLAIPLVDESPCPNCHESPSSLNLPLGRELDWREEVRFEWRLEVRQ